MGAGRSDRPGRETGLGWVEGWVRNGLGWGWVGLGLQCGLGWSGWGGVRSGGGVGLGKNVATSTRDYWTEGRGSP